MLSLGVGGGLLGLAPLWQRALRSRHRPVDIELHATPRPIPALRFFDGQGQPTTLDSFRGRVVLLNLWATWCTPCREEMPTLDRLPALMGGPGFEVLALSVDHERDTAPVLRKYVTAFHPDFLGLRADPTATAAIAKEFKFFHAAHPIAANGDYAVDQGSAIYVYGPQGRRCLLMNGRTTSKQ